MPLKYARDGRVDFMIDLRNKVIRMCIQDEQDARKSFSHVQRQIYTGLFISPSRISELDCATTKTDTAERSKSIGRESFQVFFVLGSLAYFQVTPLGGSRDEKWRSQ